MTLTEHGRAPRNERLDQEVPGKRRGRTSVIAASQGAKLVAPLTFDGTCTTEVVDAYFAEVLLPVLPRGSVLVLDNARFHQSPTTAQLVAAAGCALMFLPPYSPDLNPIEHLWAALKARLRPGLPTAASPALFIGQTCLCYRQSLYEYAAPLALKPFRVFCVVYRHESLCLVTSTPTNFG